MLGRIQVRGKLESLQAKVADRLKMKSQSLETILFLKAFERVQFYLKLVGLQLDESYNRTNIWQRIKYRWLFLLNIVWVNVATGGEVAAFIEGVSTGKGFIFLSPLALSIIMCIICNLQCLYFVKHGHRIQKLVASLRTLQSMYERLDEADEIFLKSQFKIFNIAVNTLILIKCVINIAFGISPFVLVSTNYYYTGEIKLVLPLLIKYPFDSLDIRFWPIAYIHQMWSAILACIILLSPSYLCYACTTFIIFQFHLLNGHLKNIIPYQNNLDTYLWNDDLNTKFKKIVDRHRKIIQCVDLMREVYSETNLINVVTSSILICLACFNVMAIEDLASAVPFLPFLLMYLVQIFFMCYYGDMITRFSVDISNAVYETQWYRAETKFVKDLMLLSLRAQKPCKLTASRFSDINLRTFTKILSTSWSYFALLMSMYRNNQK